MRCIGHENVVNEAYIGCGFNISIHYERTSVDHHILYAKNTELNLLMVVFAYINTCFSKLVAVVTQ